MLELGMEKLIPQPDPRKLKAARLLADVSQATMAELLNVTYEQVFNMEAGRSEPRGSQLAIWARTCGVSMESLCTDAKVSAFYFRKKLKPRQKSLDKLNAV